MSDLRITGLTKSYGDLTAVDDVTLDVASGSLTAVLGPSGCGKSTTLEMVAGLVTPDAGSISIGGTDVTSVPAEKRPLSLVFQKPLLFPHLSVARNVAFGLRMRRAPKHEVDHRVARMLDRVQLSGLADRRVHQLSGGQEQRVALARALVLEPDVLLLDEPFSALDAALRVEMRQLVRSLHDTTGVTTVFVTHDQAEAVDVADEIVVMLDGRIEAAGRPADVFATPPTLAAARFLGVTNEISGTVRGGVFGSGDLHVRTSQADGPAVLTIRPESVEIGTAHAEAVPMTVTSINFAGTHLLVTTTRGDGLVLTARVPVGTPLDVGAPTAVRLPPDRCTVFDTVFDTAPSTAFGT